MVLWSQTQGRKDIRHCNLWKEALTPVKEKQVKEPKRLSYITQLWVDLRALCFHKCKHNFRTTINPMCPTNDGVRILSTVCCIALLLMRNGAIFLLESFCYCNHFEMLILQTKFLQSFYCMVKKTFPMTLIEIYYN